ncbi:MAG: hypothetical protein AB3N13_07625 [Arenibacterium sp.]
MLIIPSRVTYVCCLQAFQWINVKLGPYRTEWVKEKTGEPVYLDPSSQRKAVQPGLGSSFQQRAAEQGYTRDMVEIALVDSSAQK